MVAGGHLGSGMIRDTQGRSDLSKSPGFFFVLSPVLNFILFIHIDIPGEKVPVPVSLCTVVVKFHYYSGQIATGRRYRNPDADLTTMHSSYL